MANSIAQNIAPTSTVNIGSVYNSDITITKHKNKGIFLCTSGDINFAAAGQAKVEIQVLVNGTYTTLCSQRVTGAGSSINTSYVLQYLYLQGSGTLSFRARFTTISGTPQLCESGNPPCFLAMEVN